MSPENIGLVLIVGYLGWWLYNVISKPEKKPDQIEVVSGKNGKIIKMTIAPLKSKEKEAAWNEDEFLNGAKIAFHIVSNAFANGKKKELKALLAPKVYDTFVKIIDQREAEKKKVDFSLICLSSTKILKKLDDAKEVTVEFISEQINLLKNEKGDVLEGDPMSVATVSDTWTFKKSKDDTWIISSTKSEAAHA